MFDIVKIFLGKSGILCQFLTSFYLGLTLVYVMNFRDEMGDNAVDLTKADLNGYISFIISSTIFVLVSFESLSSPLYGSVC